MGNSLQLRTAKHNENYASGWCVGNGDNVAENRVEREWKMNWMLGLYILGFYGDCPECVVLRVPIIGILVQYGSLSELPPVWDQYIQAKSHMKDNTMHDHASCDCKP